MLLIRSSNHCGGSLPKKKNKEKFAIRISVRSPNQRHSHGQVLEVETGGRNPKPGKKKEANFFTFFQNILRAQFQELKWIVPKKLTSVKYL